MAMGVLLILTAVAVFWNKKDFPAGGVGVTMVGLVLITISVVTHAKISVAGATLELQTIAKAVDAVAAQTQEAATSLETTKRELISLTSLLEARHVLAGTALQPMRSRLDAAPRVDLARLTAARESLRRIPKP
jgi:hypothetical protein